MLWRLPYDNVLCRGQRSITAVNGAEADINGPNVTVAERRHRRVVPVAGR